MQSGGGSGAGGGVSSPRTVSHPLSKTARDRLCSPIASFFIVVINSLPLLLCHDLRAITLSLGVSEFFHKSISLAERRDLLGLGLVDLGVLPDPRSPAPITMPQTIKMKAMTAAVMPSFTAASGHSSRSKAPGSGVAQA